MNRYLNIETELVKSNQKKYLFFDIIFSLIAIIIFTPAMIIIALLIKVNSPKNSILFKQKRLGLNGKLFYVYKFRTMLPNAEIILEEMMLNNILLKTEYLKFRKLANDPRIVPYIGNFLRRSSLDELPQFFNVLFGQMSIVGPRPYIKEEFNQHQHQQPLITAVKPGITGYWQIIPIRHKTPFNYRIDMDIEYINKKSFFLDMKIIFQTILVMFLRKGI